MDNINQIRINYLSREEPAVKDGENNRPMLLVEDKCYRVNIHQEKMKQHNQDLWTDEVEEKVLEFVKDNSLDTKCALELKKSICKGLSLLEAVERWLDLFRKPHPKYFPSCSGKSKEEIDVMWKELENDLNQIKGLKKSNIDHYKDDPTPSKWIDLEVAYL
tara:strand:+ start:8049 stop:8531 length:483 start_codon:yes stop_codon:yes gene_type:complete